MFTHHSCDVTIDLGEVMEIDRMSFSSLVDMSAYIMGVRKAEVSVSSDGIGFRKVAESTFDAPVSDDVKHIEKNNLTFEDVEARYVSVLLTGFDVLPEWHSGAGSRPFLFIDEIEVD